MLVNTGLEVSMEGKRDFVTLDDHVFPGVKRKTELYVRGNPEASDELIVTDRDRETLAEFFREFISELKNRSGRHTIDDYEDSLAVNYSEKEVERGLDKLHQTLVQVAIEFHCMRWYDGLGRLRQSQYHRNVYEKLLNDWTGNSTQKAIVTPKYHPYF